MYQNWSFYGTLLSDYEDSENEDEDGANNRPGNQNGNKRKKQANSGNRQNNNGNNSNGGNNRRSGNGNRDFEFHVILVLDFKLSYIFITKNNTKLEPTLYIAVS